jgi:hypothetical protein
MGGKHQESLAISRAKALRNELIYRKKKLHERFRRARRPR